MRGERIIDLGIQCLPNAFQVFGVPIHPTRTAVFENDMNEPNKPRDPQQLAQPQHVPRQLCARDLPDMHFQPSPVASVS